MPVPPGMSQVEASPFALMTRIFDCIAMVSLEWAKMTHAFLPQWDAKKKMPKSLKMPRANPPYNAPKKRWKESRWWQAKSRVSTLLQSMSDTWLQVVLQSIETVFFDFGCSLAIKWESEWAKSNIYSILKMCMTNSLWLVSQLKHVLWELFLGLPSVISVCTSDLGVLQRTSCWVHHWEDQVFSMHASFGGFTQVSMGQGICKCVEDEGSTSASLDVTSVPSTARKGSIPKTPPQTWHGMMHPKCHVWCIYYEDLFVRYSNGIIFGPPKIYNYQ